MTNAFLKIIVFRQVCDIVTISGLFLDFDKAKKKISTTKYAGGNAMKYTWIFLHSIGNLLVRLILTPKFL